MARQEDLDAFVKDCLDRFDKNGPGPAVNLFVQDLPRVAGPLSGDTVAGAHVGALISSCTGREAFREEVCHVLNVVAGPYPLAS